MATYTLSHLLRLAAPGEDAGGDGRRPQSLAHHLAEEIATSDA